MRILVIAAHPDDEVLGCGGTIVRYLREGHDVYVTILGEGITSRYEKREDVDPLLLANLHSTARKVANMLGVKKLNIHDFPDNRFDTVPLLDIVKAIEMDIDNVEPEVIFTHHYGDLNVDHSITHRATLTATRTLPGQKVKKIYAFEIPSSTEWSFQQLSPAFLPNTFIDIESTISEKVKALAVYDSETRNFPHPRSPEAVEDKSKVWGSLAGYKRAEAFQLIREIIGSKHTT